MTQLSTAHVRLADRSGSTPYLVVDGSHRVVTLPGAFKSAREPSKVVHASFGEWPTPALEHTDSKCIGEFVASLEAEGHADALKAARRSISSWMDPKLTLRSLRLEAGLSQDQLAALMETSQPQIARMESGKQDMQLSTLKRLATVLEIELHKVVDACG